MNRVFALANQKGGVGKTTTAISLGAYMAAKGERVLIVDMDPQANATSGLGFDKWNIGLSTYDVLIRNSDPATSIIHTNRWGLDLIGSSPELAAAEVEMVSLENREWLLRRALERIWNDYSYIFIDCPPSLGLLTVNALTAATDVIVPVQCEYLALEGLSLLLDTIERIRQSLNERLTVFGILMTMFDPRTNLSEQVIAEVREHHPKTIFDTVIPRNVRLSEAPSYGKSILDYDPVSRGATAYAALATETIARSVALAGVA